AVIERRSLTISWIRVAGTLKASASALTLNSNGTRKSSRRISPGCTGRIRLIGRLMTISSVVVDDLDFDRPCVGPGKAKPKLVVERTEARRRTTFKQRLRLLAPQGQDHDD